MRRTTRTGLMGPGACAELGAYPIHVRARRLVFGLALLMGMVSAATASQAQVQTVRVIRVVDGDTVVVSTAESLNLKVRLQGIDAPECGMPFGPQAQRFLEQLVLGRTVQMTTTGRDRYGRLVATLAAGEHDVGFALLQAGLAWHDSRYHRHRTANMLPSYGEAQGHAKLRKEGLWSTPTPTEPRRWRKNQQQPSQDKRCTPSMY